MKARRATCGMLLLVAAALLLPGYVLAQNGIPVAPAFSFIGASPAEVSRPVTAPELGADLMNAIDPSGNVQQGLAIDFAPWSLIPGLRITLQDYQQKPLKYLLTNLQASMAAVKSSGSTNDTDLGFGLRVVVYDDSDFMRYPKFIEAADHKREMCPPPAQPDPESEAAYAKCLDKSFLATVEEWQAKRAWNANALAFACASGLRLADSQLEQAEWLGLGVWMTGSIKLAGWGQLAGQVEYAFREEGSGGALNHILKAGARAIVGGRKLSASAEYLAQVNFGEIAANLYSDTYSLGFEYRIGDNLWLSSGLSASITDFEKPVSILSSLKWALLSESKLREH